LAKIAGGAGADPFALDETPEKVAIYRGARFLEGRVMFINTDEQSPAAAYLTLNRPVDDGERIARDVRAGFLVRTRADEGTWQARGNDLAHRDIALHSGAQAVSTDYLWADPRFAGGYTVSLPSRAPACATLSVWGIGAATWLSNMWTTAIGAKRRRHR
jgi:hypothetical protein